MEMNRSCLLVTAGYSAIITDTASDNGLGTPTHTRYGTTRPDTPNTPHTPADTHATAPNPTPKPHHNRPTERSGLDHRDIFRA